MTDLGIIIHDMIWLLLVFVFLLGLLMLLSILE